MTYAATRPLVVAQAKRRGLRLAVLALFVVMWALVFSAVAFANTTPTVPVNVQAIPGTTSPLIARITWNASTDDVGVSGYNVWRSLTSTGTPSLIGSTVGLRFDDVRGVPGQPYFYMVSAFDGAGLQSTRSAPVGPVRSTWVPRPHVTYTTAGNLCSSCHTPHEAATARGLLRPATGARTESSVCFTCHDGSGAINIRTGPTNSFALASGHALEERDTGADLADRCSSCHSAHGDFNVNRMLPRPSINGTTVARGNSWCLACHNSTNDWFGPGYPSMATPSRDASGFPVSGRFPGPSIVSSAGANRHALIPASTIATPSRQAGDCLYCHQSHRSANRYDALRHTYRAPSASTLASDQIGGFAESCFACHGATTPSVFATRPANMTNIRQFVATSTVATTTNMGHRIETAGGTFPVGSPMPCFSCHNPHGSSRGNASLISDERGRLLSTTSAAGVRAFCLTCHATTDGFVWNSITSTVTAVSTTETVVGLRRDGTGGTVLRLPVMAAGHNRADSRSCYECHTSSPGTRYAPGGNNVHNPGPGTPPGIVTNTLFFRPEDTVTGNIPSGDQAGDTYQAAVAGWSVRSMAPASSTVAFQSQTAAVTVPTGAQNWRMVRFVSPPVATTVSIPAGGWNIEIWVRQNATGASASMRPFVYVWLANNTRGPAIVGPANMGTTWPTTSLPGESRAATATALLPVTLNPGDRIVMDMAVQTNATFAIDRSFSYSFGVGAQGFLRAPTAITWVAP
ncbi:MAG: cytochrome c3 family protein [Actinobacteria bacterium]|nr:cytochrome c3 family protein [Actinomycetota bacterium]